jgi:RecA-family ATPase
MKTRTKTVADLLRDQLPPYARNGQAPPQSTRLLFPEPIPADQLVERDADAAWLWKGYLARNFVTLLSALWKAGKTTLLSHLLKTCGEGGQLLDQDVQALKVLYVTEEHHNLWARRRTRLGIGSWVRFLIRPFKTKPTMDGWLQFLDYLGRKLKDWPADLVVFDTLSKLWPVKDENNASEVTEALMPLRAIAEQRALLLLHHLRKSDGQEGTASRGSGALPADVDILLELRRHDAGDRHSRKRVLTGVGRFEETPGEVVI